MGTFFALLGMQAEKQSISMLKVKGEEGQFIHEAEDARGFLAQFV
jgi:hypothetical protein